MGRRYLLVGIGVLILAVAFAISGFAQPGMGPHSPGGPGGPGIMGSGDPGYGPTAPAAGQVTLDGAVDRVRDMLRARDYADLVVEEVMEFSNHFYVLVKEKSIGVGAMELIVERTDGNQGG